MMNFKDKLTDKEIEYLLSLVESDYEEVAQYVDSKELEKVMKDEDFQEFLNLNLNNLDLSNSFFIFRKTFCI